MKKALCLKLISFSIVFSLVAAVSFWGCSDKNTASIEEKVNFKIEKSLFSDDDNNPYYFGSIFEVCANSKYIYVSDWKKYTVNIFDFDFKLVKEFGRKGNGPGEFGQIFADLKCDEERVYILTINRLYIFSAEGDFQKEIKLRFIPRTLFVLSDSFIFKMDGSVETFFETDFDGNIISKFHLNSKMSTRECGTVYISPQAFVSVTGKLFIMDSLKYEINIMNLSTRKIEKTLSRIVDFDKAKCTRLSGNGAERYAMTGGFSWMLENQKNYYYFYYNSEKEMKIDVYEKDTLTLIKKYSYAGKLRPLCIHPENNKMIGMVVDESDTLKIATLKEVTQ